MKRSGSGKAWQQVIRKAPAEPGVYVMRDAARRVLYVGKAKSLRSRVRGYLDPERHSGKTALMLREAEDLELLVTDSELEALILENSLIKRWRPKYNISLRDDKTYPFLRISLQEEYPTLTVVRRPAEDGARYFGPYVPAGAMRRTLRLLRRIFPLRQCRKKVGHRRERPCLNYQMGRCTAPCAGRTDPAGYGELVRGVTLFLQGRGRELAAELRREMGRLAGERRFEEAAVLRDRIAAIESTLERQKVHLTGKGDLDVFGTVSLGERRAVAVLHLNHGRVVGMRTFVLEGEADYESDREGLGNFLRAFYDSRTFVPPEIALPLVPAGAEVLASWLKEKRAGRVSLRVPRGGPVRSLVTMASRNALRSLEAERAGGNAGSGTLEELGKIAGCKGPPRSVAAVDVSSLSGSDAVASLVWWEGGRFVKKRYRRFRMRTAPAADDSAMIAEAVGRLAARVSEGQWEAPDVLLLDGGRGQLSSGRKALRKVPWRPLLLAAIAKPRENRRSDAVYIEGSPAPLGLGEDSRPLKLLQQIRDEAHRFALTYHRSLRQRRNRRSVLDAVPGLGPERRKKLLRTFGSVKILQGATLEEISAVPGIPRKVAEHLYRHFHG